MSRFVVDVKIKPSARDLRAAFKEHRTIEAVAALYGVCGRTIQRWVASYRLTDDSGKSPISIPTLPPGRRTRGAKERACAQKMLAAGKNTLEAAKAAGVSRRTVERWRAKQILGSTDGDA
jgi:transposase